jgi:spermidine/putrescine transport system ATP-binding protein
MASVTLADLTKEYGDLTAVDGLDLEVDDGELLCLLGPSGCGKSTTLRMLGGLETPTAGDLHIGDDRVTDQPPYERNTSMVFQSWALFPQKNVLENVAFGLKMDGVDEDERRERAREVLEIVEMSEFEDADPGDLSGGQKQRVALARSLAIEPDVLLLDEPLSNLDAPIRRRLRTQLDGVFDDLGVPVVVVTHDQRAAAALADRVAVMHDGDVVQAGTVDAVLDRPATPFVARFVGANVLPGALVDRESRVAIRPEHVEFGGDHPATVRAVHREGAASRVTVVLSSTEDTDAHAGTPDTDAHAGTPDTVVDAFAADPPAVGETVGVALPDDHLVALGEQG